MPGESGAQPRVSTQSPSSSMHSRQGATSTASATSSASNGNDGADGRATTLKPHAPTIGASDTKILAILVALRLLNAIAVRTWFVPDEYWQSLEVAHKIVFGYGYETWEWNLGVRSYIHPLMFAVLYKALQLLNLDTAAALIVGPRLLQGCLQAIGDFFLFKLARRIFGAGVARWTLLCAVLSWFQFYCGVRTLSNSAEASLMNVALYYWPWTGTTYGFGRLGLFKSLSMGALACIVRPSCVITWLYLAAEFVAYGPATQATQLPSLQESSSQSLHRNESAQESERHSATTTEDGAGSGHVAGESNLAASAVAKEGMLQEQGHHGPNEQQQQQQRQQQRDQQKTGSNAALDSPSHRLRVLLLTATPLGFAAIALTAAIDSHFYGRFVFPPFEFFRFNVLRGGGAFYGSHAWHWYASQGIPTVLFTLYPFFLLGVRGCVGGLLAPFRLLLFQVVAWSALSSHKEFRFLMPALPTMLCYCGRAFGRIVEPEGKPVRHRAAFYAFVFIVATQLPLAFYTSFVHQSGPIDVIQALREDLESNHPGCLVANEHAAAGSLAQYSHAVVDPPLRDSDALGALFGDGIACDAFVLFLLPCHSTPFYSHLHLPVLMRFLECPPSDDPEYVDEADVFFHAPVTWIDSNWPLHTSRVAVVGPWNDRRIDASPSHVVVGAALYPVIFEQLRQRGFQQCGEYFYDDVGSSARIGSHIIVMCHTD
eukprot:Opistho-2@13174